MTIGDADDDDYNDSSFLFLLGKELCALVLYLMLTKRRGERDKLIDCMYI